jgi:hypothetical protein
MKIAIYLSGITGTLLLIIRITGIFLSLPSNRFFLISGLILLLVVFFPLLLIERYRYYSRIDKIIDSYKGKNRKTDPAGNVTTETKGWNMNNSPFRERKSGVTWGGGSIKGANATRGTRKSFLK